MPSKMDRCLEKVRKSLKKRKKKGNPWAICTARLKKKRK